MKVVLDTNVLISALLFPGGAPDLVFQAAIKGRFELVLSPFIFGEIARVLERKFGYQPSELLEIRQFIENVASLTVHPQEIPEIISAKASDNQILACAPEADPDYLVSGDTKHIQPLGRINRTQIVSPSNFLAKVSNPDVNA